MFKDLNRPYIIAEISGKKSSVESGFRKQIEKAYSNVLKGPEFYELATRILDSEPMKARANDPKVVALKKQIKKMEQQLRKEGIDTLTGLPVGMTQEEFEGVKSGEITEPTGQFAADGGRIGAAEGGIMDLESSRQMYGLGKLVKKVTRSIKKIAKSPIGKAALLYAGGTYLGGLNAFGGSGTFMSNLKSGQGIGLSLIHI